MLRPSIFSNNFMDDMFDDMFSMPFGMSRGQNNYQALMNADVQETDNGYLLDLELPGFKKEDLKAELKDGYLTINASHTESNEDKNQEGKFIRKERYSGQCQRSFYVGEAVTQEDIKAKFENGVLRLEIPKKEEAEPVQEKHYIQIAG